MKTGVHLWWLLETVCCCGYIRLKGEQDWLGSIGVDLPYDIKLRGLNTTKWMRVGGVSPLPFPPPSKCLKFIHLTNIKRVLSLFILPILEKRLRGGGGKNIKSYWKDWFLQSVKCNYLCFIIHAPFAFSNTSTLLFQH